MGFLVNVLKSFQPQTFDLMFIHLSRRCRLGKLLAKKGSLNSRQLSPDLLLEHFHRLVGGSGTLVSAYYFFRPCFFRVLTPEHTLDDGVVDVMDL